jgi:formylglycine-generating enzyme required for sulfatase activity
VAITHAGEGLAFDNETPRHRALLQPFEIGHRRVTNGEYQAFVDDGGYRRPALWLSDGWAMVQAQGWLVLRPLPTLARRAGWAPQTVWTDGAHRFSPHWLEPAA